MRRNWMMLGLAALVGLILACPAASARPPELTDEEARKDIEALKKELAALRKTYEFDLRSRETEMRLLEDRLRRIEESLARLGPTVTSRQSSYFTPTPPGAVGHVRLINRLGVMARVTVNGVSYTVPPFGSRVVRDVPAGTLVYEVTADGFGLGPPVRTPLSPDETVTLTVY
jgi:hypothetical protein